MRARLNIQRYLYHGTIDLYGRIIQHHGIKIIKRPKGNVDFGPGFYVTVGLLHQAVKWAEDKSRNPTYSREALDIVGLTFSDFFKIKNDVRPVVLKFRIKNTESWTNLRHKVFERDDIDWKNFVFQSRKKEHPPTFDWIFGPVADGGLGQESPQTIRSLYRCNQMSIHSSQALNMLELVEVISC